MKKLVILLLLSVSSIASAQNLVHQIYVVTKYGRGFGASDAQIESAHKELEKNCKEIYGGELDGTIYDIKRFSGEYSLGIPVDTHEVYSIGKCEVN
ncbi:MAG: hypothetical protein ACXWRE_13905 [Pseudobdellovibrionaceae bacterium]